MAEKEGLFGGALGLLGRHFVLTTADMAACDQDDTPDLRAVAAVLERVLEIRKTSLQQRRLVRLQAAHSMRLRFCAWLVVWWRCRRPAALCSWRPI